MVSELSGEVRTLIYDPYHNLQGIRRDTVRGIVGQLKRPAGMVTFSNPDLAPALLGLLAELGNCVFLADEAQDIFPRHKIDPRALEAIRKGRNTGLGILWSTQRPTACHTDLLGNTQALIVGRLLGMADRAYCQQWGIEQPIPLHTFKGVFPRLDEQITFQSRKYHM